MDPTLLALSQDAGARLDRVVLGSIHEPVDPGDQVVDLVRCEVACSSPGEDPLDEESLARPVGADSCQGALVEEGVADKPFVCREVGCRPGRVPVGAEDVRAQMADEGVFLSRGDEVEHAEAKPDGGPVFGGQQGAKVMTATGALGLGAGVDDAPLPFHPQVRVEGEP
jgi:hypothetical protein